MPPKCPEMARFRPPAGVSLSLFDTGVRGQGSGVRAAGAKAPAPLLDYAVVNHDSSSGGATDAAEVEQAAQRLGVSPSTLDRMIRRGELEIEREGRGDRAKVWVLAPGLSSDAPGGQPVDAGPSPEAELAAAREQARALQELADYRGKLLDEAEWRYRELLEELRRSQAMLEGLTRALPPGGTEESPRGRRWWPFGPG